MERSAKILAAHLRAEHKLPEAVSQGNRVILRDVPFQRQLNLHSVVERAIEELQKRKEIPAHVVPDFRFEKLEITLRPQEGAAPKRPEKPRK